MSDIPPSVKKLNLHRPKSDKPRLTTKERGYGHQWQKIRFRKLKESPLCEFNFPQICQGYADQVHHRNHITGDNRPENLLSSCSRCHQEYHRHQRKVD